jgi:hypothetical protein
MQTAEEGRLNRMGQYAARPPARRSYAPEGGAIEGNAADDALLVDHGPKNSLTINRRQNNLQDSFL